MAQRITEVKFTTDKNGKRRAFYWSMPALRWFPMKVAVAEALIASGEATEYRESAPVAAQPVVAPVVKAAPKKVETFYLLFREAKMA